MNFNLDSRLRDIYAGFPYGRKPIIGISANFDWNNATATLSRSYYQQVARAGGVPVLVPPVADESVILGTLGSIDGLVLSGGADLNPLWAGEEPSPQLHHINKERDLPELILTRLAYERQIPILGICRGIQTMAVALGGEVEQDISRGASMQHSQDADRDEPTHSVRLEEGSTLRALYGNSTIFVNSFHHQAVRATGRRFVATAWAPDGTIEAMESAEHKPLLGVQWHPECLHDDGLPVFRWLVGEAEMFARAKRLHESIPTLDSHCDTPMFFHAGADFSRRDNRVLVDVEKMTCGRLDATTMVAYIPQPKNPTLSPTGEDSLMASPLEGEADVKVLPHVYAEKVFDRIEQIATRRSDVLALGRSREDLVRNKREGKRTIFRAIENGLAIERDLGLVDYFASRGAVYITLCHNGDNQLCDSARNSRQTWGGLSPFGHEAVLRMNKCGVMVDLSHAAETSFYDALEASCTPVVCSHSNCRALCDHPRNLTDQQLRALAAKGGVCQVTLYPGFLRADSEATILDAIAHLNHAVEVMGIEHVGLGTDFDGDGGVPGFANAAEALLFTRQLLLSRYSPEDIEMIWGGNWLRVMEQVQRSRDIYNKV